MPDQLSEKEIHSLANVLAAVPKDAALIEKAIADNSWFTPFYISSSIQALLTWFKTPADFTPFLPDSTQSEKRLTIGIIMAGNLPLVGFHDVFLALLSGHHVRVKLSHKDRIVLPVIIQRWLELISPVLPSIQFTDDLSSSDFIVATGSDNASRFFEYQFASIPKVIRKNRYSVAVLSGNESDNELKQLCEDLLLYDGFGCRNVSLLLVPEEYNNRLLVNHLNSYPLENLSSNYLSLLKRETVIAQITQTQHTSTRSILIREIDQPTQGKPAWLNICKSSPEEIENWIASSRHELQCVVGKGRKTGFGETQIPRFNDFADGINLKNCWDQERS